MNKLDANPHFSDLCRQNHPTCFVCGPANSYGLGLEFHMAHDGCVEATFSCQPVFAGYPGIVHGGIICALLDGAMTNCLFAYGLVAVTADMHVRFREPVKVSLPAVVRARLEAGGSPLHQLAAQMIQSGHVVATAAARFVDKDAMPWLTKRGD